jgi:tellurite resistance protein TerC
MWDYINYRQARRIVIGMIGGTVLLFGLALVVLPGPAILVIPAGLAILATEFAWAKRWLRKAKRIIRNATNRNGSGDGPECSVR